MVKHETVSKTSNSFFFVRPTEFFCKIDVLSMTTRVFITSLNTKAMTRKKNGFVTHFVESGSMKAVFTDYSCIMYYIFIVF